MPKYSFDGFRPPLPSVLTSYDFLKAAALLLMIVDHAGYFFFPEEQWMRAVGRLSAPIWLFLIGFAHSRDLSLRMWGGMGILLLSNYVAGMPLLPANILATMILCRLAIDPVMGYVARNPKTLYPVVGVLFCLIIPTFMMFEYGSVALLVVMLGYMVRNRDDLPFTRNDIVQFAGIVALLYGFIQIFTFVYFSMTMKVGVQIGLLMVMVFLTRFRPYEYPSLTGKLPAAVAGLIRLAGRRTLEFYVLHLVLFKAASYYLGVHATSPFTLHIW